MNREPLVQLDSKQVPVGKDKVLYQFGAVDCISRKRVVLLVPRLTSAQGAVFLQRLTARFPFPVEATQSDGGSEFLGAFSAQVETLGMIHYFNRPRYSEGKGMVERSFRTDEEEFYQRLL
ncbi:hypothetical protein ACFLX9_04385 [Chloroflexota bacterium]